MYLVDVFDLSTACIFSCSNAHQHLDACFSSVCESAWVCWFWTFPLRTKQAPESLCTQRIIGPNPLCTPVRLWHIQVGSTALRIWLWYKNKVDREIIFFFSTLSLSTSALEANWWKCKEVKTRRIKECNWTTKKCTNLTRAEQWNGGENWKKAICGTVIDAEWHRGKKMHKKRKGVEGEEICLFSRHLLWHWKICHN